MAFDEETKKKADDYARAHIGDEAWHIEFFDFIDDAGLARRLGQEFISTRYIYKLLEGVEAEGWLLRAQIRLQILAYASIYEAALHHILFNNLALESEVIALTEFPMKKVISIPAASMDILIKYLEHDGRQIIPTYEGIGKTDESKVRFDKKAECASRLGIIEKWLKDELVEFYEARNSIHIHAEIRKSIEYELELSRNAYRRLQPFKEQVIAWKEKRPCST